MSLTAAVAKNLKRARLARNFSQGSLAQRARLSVSYVSMLERGQRSPPLDTLEVLAAALQVKPVALLAGK